MKPLLTQGFRLVGCRLVIQWIGHRDIKTTMIYADYQASEQERQLVERAFGLENHDLAELQEKEEHR